MLNAKPEISYEDFEKIDVRVGTILSAERVEKSDKLLKFEVDFGDVIGKRQILAGIGRWYNPEDLVGLQTTFVVNMPTRKLMGFESQGMLFAIGLNDEAMPSFLISKNPVENGDGAR